MINNTQTILGILLALACLGLGVVLAGVAFRVLVLRARDRQGEEGSSRLEHLMELLVLVLGVVSFLSWLQFYALLQSYVPDLAPLGVMCAYGVAQINRRTVFLVQCLIPATLWCVGLFYLLSHADRQAARQTPSSRRKQWTKGVMALAVAVVATAGYAIEFVYIFATKTETRVTCCTQFTGTSQGLLPLVSPLAAWTGPGSQGQSLAIYFAANGAVIAIGLLFSAGKRRFSPYRLIVLSLACVANLLITYGAWLDALAPLVLQLPYHHCIYELLTDTWAMGLAAMCAVAGNAGLLWVPALGMSGVGTTGSLQTTQQSVVRFCALMLATELLIVAIHLV